MEGRAGVRARGCASVGNGDMPTHRARLNAEGRTGVRAGDCAAVGNGDMPTHRARRRQAAHSCGQCLSQSCQRRLEYSRKESCWRRTAASNIPCARPTKAGGKTFVKCRRRPEYKDWRTPRGDRSSCGSNKRFEFVCWCLVRGKVNRWDGLTWWCSSPARRFCRLRHRRPQRT